MKKLIMLAVAVIAIVGYFTYSYMSGTGFFAKAMDDLERNERLSLKRNIVVLGIDGRESEDDVGRSDTLFVVMLDSKSKNAALLSIPRDTRVRIPEHGWDKINHAYGYGGHKLTQQTTEELLGVRIDNYVMVDFKGFEGLVDAIGGIDIEIDKPMHYYDEWDGFLIDLAPGMQHLDGAKAIQYVRYRDEEGDIGRIKRQQKFLMAVYDKVSSAQILTKMPGLVKEITSMVQTDMPLSDMATLGAALHGMVNKQGGLAMATVPGTPEYIDEISYWIPDITDLREQMVQMQGAEMTERYRKGAERMEEEYRRNLLVNKEKLEQEQKEVQEKENSAKLKTSKIAEDGEKKVLEKKRKQSTKEEVPLTKIDGENKLAATPKVIPPPSKEVERHAITVKLVNCSGNTAFADSARSRLSKMGLNVIDGGSDEARAATSIVSTTTSGRVVSKLSGVPFPYSLHIVKMDQASYDAVIYLGEDYQ